MKKLLFLFMILLCGSIKIKAQNWAPIGAEWFYNIGDGTKPPWAEYTHYTSTKDTIYASRNCRKIEGTLYKYRNAEIVKLDPWFTYQSNDTVYFFHKDYKKFVPVYIFNVKAGDTLTFYNPWINSNKDSTFRVIVDSVSTLDINSLSLQNVHYSKLPSDSHSAILNSNYIERIGSLNRFFNPTEWITTADQHFYIRCYKDNEISFQLSNNIACDYRETTSILANKKQDSQIKIFPNPATDIIRIENPEENNFNYAIFNQLGQRVKEGNMVYNENVINISTLPKGLFIVKIYYQNNQSAISKFIKE